MSFDEDNRQWICGKVRTVNLHRVSSIVRDIGEPCLHQPHIKVIIAVRTLKNIIPLLLKFLQVVYTLCFSIKSKQVLYLLVLL